MKFFKRIFARLYDAPNVEPRPDGNGKPENENGEYPANNADGGQRTPEEEPEILDVYGGPGMMDEPGMEEDPIECAGPEPEEPEPEGPPYPENVLPDDEFDPAMAPIYSVCSPPEDVKIQKKPPYPQNAIPPKRPPMALVYGGPEYFKRKAEEAEAQQNAKPPEEPIMAPVYAGPDFFGGGEEPPAYPQSAAEDDDAPMETVYAGPKPRRGLLRRPLMTKVYAGPEQMAARRRGMEAVYAGPEMMQQRPEDELMKGVYGCPMPPQKPINDGRTENADNPTGNDPRELARQEFTPQMMFVYAGPQVSPSGGFSFAPIPQPARKGRFCPICGTPAAESAKFCTECGARLPEPKTDEKPDGGEGSAPRKPIPEMRSVYAAPSPRRDGGGKSGRNELI